MSQKAMQAAMYVGLIKMADAIHLLADQVWEQTGESRKPIEQVHRDIEANLEENLQYFAKCAELGRTIPMEALEQLNKRIVQVKAKLRD